MARRGAATAPHLQPVPLLRNESLYVGIDVGKLSNIAGFVSRTLLERHQRFEGCPSLSFEQSREGYRRLADRIESLAPLPQVYILLEKTGHYHHALLQYLLDLDFSVYLIHVQQRQAGLLKTDKRDALGLANTLYTQLELGAQVASRTDLARRAVPPTESAALLRGLIRHRYELTREITRHKNKLTAICDELFPEFTKVFKNPNAQGALALRERFPTPVAIATASMSELVTVRVGRHPSEAKLQRLQDVARDSIGIRDLGRQRGLMLEQRHLIQEMQLLQGHVTELDIEIKRITERSREGCILCSLPGVGPIQAATVIAAIGHIDNFRSAGALRSYFGWAPQVARSGTSVDKVRQTRGGTRTVRQILYLSAANAIQLPCEWAQIYKRLVPIKCRYDERLHTYVGRNRVMARIVGQMISTMYALLKQDAEMLSRHRSGQVTPDPILYDPAVHRAHREGQYKATRPKQAPTRLVSVPTPLL